MKATTTLFHARRAAVTAAAIMGTACLIAANASWAVEDSVTALIRIQTDAFSKASDLQDQAAMDRLLDPDVLFSGGSGEVDRDPQRDKTDPVSALLERQTQEFRNAGQRGDVATMRGYLDPKVLFVDEDGAMFGRHGFRLGAPVPPPGSVSSQVTVKEWVVHHGDDVAVSSFIDDQQVDYGGYSVDYRFLSVETWIKRANAWRLLGSETIPLHENPVPAAVSAQALDEFVGEYSDGAALTITVSRDGDALTSSANGDKASTLVAEARDLFFRPDTHPGYGRRRVMFRRDAGGRVTEYVSGDLVLARTQSSTASGVPTGQPTTVASSLTLRDFVVHRAGNVAVASFLHDRVVNYHGHALHATYRSIETWIKHDQAWTMLASQGRELQRVAPAATLPAQQSDDYVGAFRLGRTFTVKISSVGGTLFASTNGLKGVALVPVAGDIFIVATTPRTMFMFRRNAGGCVTGVVERRDERDLTLSRAQDFDSRRLPRRAALNPCSVQRR